MTDPTMPAARADGSSAPPAELTTPSPAVIRREAARRVDAAPDMGAAAAIWAGRGAHVVPFHCRTGDQLAPPMTDAGEIAEAWARDPHAQIGAAVGRRFGVFAVVADPMDWDSMAQGRPQPGPRWRGGATWREIALFRWSPVCDGIVRPGRLYRAPGVNVLAGGSAVMLPPSPPGGAELVVITPGEIAPPPAWLLEELAFDGLVLSLATGRGRLRDHIAAAPAGETVAEPASPTSSRRASSKSAPAPSPAKGAEPDKAGKRRAARRTAWARSGIRRELAGIRAGDGAAEALGRAAWALGRFVAGGDLDQADAEAKLWGQARALGLVGQLGEAEVSARIGASLKRGVDAGARQPAEAS
jgi:hypothetical protein